MSASTASRHTETRRATTRRRYPKSTANPTTQCRSKKSPLKVSSKREYCAGGPETFGRFSLRLPVFGVWRPDRNAQKPRKIQVFRALVDRNPRSSDCVAGAGGIEPPNGGIK